MRLNHAPRPGMLQNRESSARHSRGDQRPAYPGRFVQPKLPADPVRHVA